MEHQLLELCQALDPKSFIQGLTAGSGLTVILTLITTTLRWSPKHLFAATRALVAKRGALGLVESVGLSLLLDVVKVPVDFAKGIRKV